MTVPTIFYSGGSETIKTQLLCLAAISLRARDLQPQQTCVFGPLLGLLVSLCNSQLLPPGCTLKCIIKAGFVVVMSDSVHMSVSVA